MIPLSKILMGAGCLMAFLIVIVIAWLLVANAHLKTQLAQEQSNSTACHLANDNFVDVIARQNKAVMEIKAEQDIRSQQAQQTIAAFQESARAALRQADKIRKASIQGDVCAATQKLLNDYWNAQP